MSTVFKEIIPSKQMESAQTTQYTAPTTAKTAIDKFTATNTSVSSATIKVNLVPTGGSVGDANTIVYQKTINAGETYIFPELVGHYLDAGGFISTSGTASALTIRCSGREIS